MTISDPLVVNDSFLATATDVPSTTALTEAGQKGPPEPQSAKQRWTKRGVVVSLVLAGTYFLYVLVLNLAFATGLFAWLVNKATPDFRIEMGSAWTLVPGRVHVKDCSLRVEDSNLQFLMFLPESVVDIDVFAFFHRTVHFKKADAKGVRCWVRQKVADTNDPKLAARVARSPQIPGFDAVPLKAKGPKKPMTPEEIAKLWSIQLDDTNGTIGELWFEEYRFKGAGYIHGAFRFDPLRKLYLEATQLDLRDGQITVGEETVANDVNASVRAAVPQVDVGTLEGTELLRVVEAKIDLGAKLSVFPTKLYFDEDVALGDRGAELALSIGLHHGVLESGSRIRLAVDATARIAEMDVHGDVNVEASVREEGRVEVLAGIPVLTALVGDDTGKTTLTTRGVEAHVTFSIPTLDQPSFRGGTVSILSLDAPDLLFLSRLIGPGVARAGKFHASFRGKFDSQYVVRGAIAASATGVNFAFPDANVKATLNFTGAYTSAPFFQGGRIAEAKIEAPFVALAIPGLPERSTWLVGTAQELVWTGLVPKSFSARAFVSGADSRILTAAVERDGGVEAMAARSLVGSAPFNAGGSLHVAAGVIRVRIGQAVAGRVAVTGGLVQRQSGLDAAFLLRALGLNVGLSIAHGEVSVKPLKSPEWLDGEMKRLGLLSAAEGNTQSPKPKDKN
jgi:hypothetical protein